MTTLTQEPARTASPARGNSLTGTGRLIRFMLRRDRIKLPAWLLGITLFVLYYGVALPELYPAQEDLEAVTVFTDGPMGALIAGPGFGMDNPTIEIVMVGVYGLYFLIIAAIMNILLVSRHTRVEEQSGRAELVRASVIGRHAQLTAVLIVAVVANVLLSLMIAGAMGAADLDTSDALLFGASIGAAGLVWAAITGLTVQVTEYSRAASGLAGAALGAAYVIRSAGDMLEQGGSLLSWFSPLAWSQQTRAYADGRWWPLALSVGFAIVVAGAGYVLSTKRDVGAGLVAARGGSPEAAPWLASPLTFAFRLHRASLIGWSAALVAAGALYGALTQPIVDAFDDFPETMIDVLGGDATQMLDGYMSVMALTVALVVTIFAILGVQSVRGEEIKGRAEPVLATATSRWSWLGTHVVVLAAGAAALLAATGLALGIATAISVDDTAYIWATLAAHLAYIPAVLGFIGLATLLFGFWPRVIGVTWALLGFGLIVGFFGPLTDLPQWVVDISPFEHVSRLPLDPMSWPPFFALTAIAAALIVVGLGGFRRRDLETT